MKDKLWKDCSKEEHNAVNNWNKKRKTIIKKYKENIITKQQFDYELGLLKEELDEIERYYSD